MGHDWGRWMMTDDGWSLTTLVVLCHFSPSNSKKNFLHSLHRGRKFTKRILSWLESCHRYWILTCIIGLSRNIAWLARDSGELKPFGLSPWRRYFFSIPPFQRFEASLNLPNPSRRTILQAPSYSQKMMQTSSRLHIFRKKDVSNFLVSR